MEVEAKYPESASVSSAGSAVRRSGGGATALVGIHSPYAEANARAAIQRFVQATVRRADALKQKRAQWTQLASQLPALHTLDQLVHVYGLDVSRPILELAKDLQAKPQASHECLQLARNLEQGVAAIADHCFRRDPVTMRNKEKLHPESVTQLCEGMTLHNFDKHTYTKVFADTEWDRLARETPARYVVVGRLPDELTARELQEHVHARRLHSHIYAPRAGLARAPTLGSSSKRTAHQGQLGGRDGTRADEEYADSLSDEDDMQVEEEEGAESQSLSAEGLGQIQSVAALMNEASDYYRYRCNSAVLQRTLKSSEWNVASRMCTRMAQMAVSGTDSGPIVVLAHDMAEDAMRDGWLRFCKSQIAKLQSTSEQKFGEFLAMQLRGIAKSLKDTTARATNQSGGVMETFTRCYTEWYLAEAECTVVSELHQCLANSVAVMKKLTREAPEGLAGNADWTQQLTLWEDALSSLDARLPALQAAGVRTSDKASAARTEAIKLVVDLDLLTQYAHMVQSGLAFLDSAEVQSLTGTQVRQKLLAHFSSASNEQSKGAGAGSVDGFPIPATHTRNFRSTVATLTNALTLKVGRDVITPWAQRLKGMCSQRTRAVTQLRPALAPAITEHTVPYHGALVSSEDWRVVWTEPGLHHALQVVKSTQYMRKAPQQLAREIFAVSRVTAQPPRFLYALQALAGALAVLIFERSKKAAEAAEQAQQRDSWAV